MLFKQKLDQITFLSKVNSVTRLGSFQCEQIVRFIERTLGNFLKPVATISLPKSGTLLCNFCEGVEIFHFSSEIVFLVTFYWSHWQLYTVVSSKFCYKRRNIYLRFGLL